MATVILQAVGSAIGAAVGGPIGAVVGRSLGAIGGSYIDQQLFGPGDQHFVGPRLENAQLLSSREGASIPKVYGRARVAGEIIWATRFEEVQSVETSSQGGKGSPPKTTVTSFSYFANFAIGLCQGEVGGIGRIWADGKLIDQPQFTTRLHKGDQEQLPDSLIEAKQGVGNAPAYRGTAYLVFENFPLEKYGNRIPQIAVEIIRPIGLLEKHVRAVNMIPGATEFGYDTQAAVKSISASESVKVNVNQTLAETDFLASLDELIAICPNLKQIALVVTWFGTDLRAQHCELHPGVEAYSNAGLDETPWTVSGISRNDAHLISRIDGSPAYGGTPSDASIVRAIREIRSRGIAVCLNPFIMMDVPSNNGLSNPYGGNEQPIYPWRGRITCDPAASVSGTADQTAAGRTQINAFAGDALPNQFSAQSDTIAFSGNVQWSYKRMLLHYAHLAELAGGIDMFLIGSEMRGLTSVRDHNDSFPFVDHLCSLADEVKSIVGSACLVTYGADWSEYFGFHPQDGLNNVYFNLDPLWSRPSVGAVGIDNYMPLSDWRPHSDLSDIGRNSADPENALANIKGGEGYDWYYQTPEDRIKGDRSSITDGLGKPWVFRYKDLESWWSNPHFERSSAVEASQATPWVPKSKPFIFTEFGCPAIDTGNNQPNVFFDPKSSESHVPYFSSGGRDDYAQAVYIAAHQQHWDSEHPKFNASNNPISPIYGERMVDAGRSQLWAWDARPYPAFPDRDDLWSDHINWNTGHWLNGRLGGVRLADLLAEILTEQGLYQFDVSKVTGSVDGYLVADVGSARSAMEFLLELYQISVFEDAGILTFCSPGKDPKILVGEEDLVQRGEVPILAFTRSQQADIPDSVHVRHIDPRSEFQESETSASRIDQTERRQQWLSGPLVVERQKLSSILESWLRRRSIARDGVTFSVPPRRSELTVGDEIVLDDDLLAPSFQISEVEEGQSLKISARAIETAIPPIAPLASTQTRTPGITTFGKPSIVLMDLPGLPGNQIEDGNKIAVSVTPWSGIQNVYASAGDDGYKFVQSIENSAFVGELAEPLQGSQVFSRWDYSSHLIVQLQNGLLSSSSKLLALNGANTLFVHTWTGGWEVIQFEIAELIAQRTWRLSGLLRGQAGTEKEALIGAGQSSQVVVFNSAVEPLLNAPQYHGLDINWLVGPQDKSLGGLEFSKTNFAPGHRAQVPFQPAHLKAKQTPMGGLLINWIRRDRGSADSWSLQEIPLSESSERYLIELTTGDDSLSREVGTNFLELSATEIAEAFAGQPSLKIRVAQFSQTVGAGPFAETTVEVI